MTDKHTAGPWHIDTWHYPQAGRGDVTVILTAVDAVAEVKGLWRGGADDTAEREANARLIAAAPDLKAAASWVLALIDGGEAMPKPGDDVALALRAALEKTES